MTGGPPSFGVNLMPSLWDGQPGVTGSELLARRRRLLGRMSEAGLDHVMLGDHVMFQGGLGNDGMIDTASALTANEKLAVYLAVYLLVLRHPMLVARQLITVAQLAPGWEIMENICNENQDEHGNNLDVQHLVGK